MRSIAALGLVLFACAGPAGEAAPRPVSATEGHAFCVRPGDPLAAIRAAQPQLALVGSDDRATVLRGELQCGSDRYDATLTFGAGRLAQVGASRDGGTLEELRALEASLEDAFGPGRARVCTEVDVDPEAALRSGRGSVSRRWEREDLRATVELTSRTPSGTRLELHLADPHALAPLDLDAPKRAGRKQASACPEIGAAPPTALGFELGASAAATRAELGTDAAVERFGVSLPHTVAGVEGRLQLSIYDDCLAGVLFVAPGSRASFESLEDALRRELGAPVQRQRCTETGAPPTEAEVADGDVYLLTRWRTERVEGQVRLWPDPAGGGPQIVVEVEARALAHRAPPIDFDESSAAASR